MRLWHKAWCETRTRFALAVVGVVAAVLLGALGETGLHQAAFGESTSTLYVLLVVLLGSGTLRQERALGTIGFTLSLPVTRARLFWTRAAVGAAQVAVLAALPALLVVVGDRAAPAGAVGSLAAGWLACGLVLFAAALAVATRVNQELVAWLVTYSLFFAYEGLVNVTALRRVPELDLYRLMSASRMTDAALWPRLAVVLLVALAILRLAQRSPEREREAEAAVRPAPSLAPPRGVAFALVHKAWRESRARFLVAAAVLVGLSLVFVVFHRHFRGLLGDTAPPDYAGYLDLRFYTVGRSIFALLVPLLALGGLHRENALGTAGFSLALPITRDAHTAARAAVGLAQVALLAWLPALVVPLASAAVGERFAWSDAASFAVLWTAAGGAIFGVTFVISTLVRSEVAGFAAALIVMRLAPVALARLGVGGPAAGFDPVAKVAFTAAAIAIAVWFVRRGRFA